MDIAFKRNNEKSDLEEIRANGQVLFQDIAGDVEMLSPVRLAKIADERESSRKRQQPEKEEKDTLAPDRLFKTVVNVKELYDMRLTLLENDEKNTPVRAKQASDLDIAIFQSRWSCRQNGKAMGQKNKNELFKQLRQQQPELFTYVQADVHQFYVIAKENISAFKQALAEKGYEALSPRDKLHEAQKKAAAAHTPAEKQKYLAAARKIFRALNPQLEKQNLCAACQQKISAGR